LSEGVPSAGYRLPVDYWRLRAIHMLVHLQGGLNRNTTVARHTTDVEAKTASLQQSAYLPTANPRMIECTRMLARRSVKR